MTIPALASMTGYARATGAAGGTVWAWEVKTVNGKALEVRCRVPPGFDRVEAPARARIASRCTRGTIHAGLTVQRSQQRQSVRVNKENLDALLASLDGVARTATVGPVTLDGLLAIPGIVEVALRGDDDGETQRIADEALATLDHALDDCVAMRGREGTQLGLVLGRRLDAIRRLVTAAETTPGRTPDAVRAKLARRVAELAAAVPALDPARLHAEAVLLAAKADVREELDRLVLHVAAATDLLGQGGPVGRKLDFLAQELGREASTLCAKSSDAALTSIGLDLRTEIDQFREQVQNLE